MNKLSLFPQNSCLEVKSTEKFGLPGFVQSVMDSITIPRKWLRYDSDSYLSESDAKSRIKQTGLEFLSKIETDHQKLLQRQDFTKWLFSNDEFIDFLLTTKYPLKHESGRYTQIRDVLAMRKYVSRLLAFLNENSYSKKFVKTTKKELSHVTQVDELISACQSIKIDGVICFNKNYNRTSYYFSTKNLHLRLIGKNNKYLLNILDYVDGNVSYKGCSIEYNGGEGKIPHEILKLVIKKAFSLYESDLIKLQSSKIGNVVVSFEISNITPKSAQCIVSLNGFHKKYELCLAELKETNSENEDIELRVLVEGDDLSKCRVKANISPIDELIELPGKEFAHSSKGFMNKVADTVDEFLDSKFMYELIFLACIAKHYKSSKRKFVFPAILPKEDMKIKINLSHNPLYVNSLKSVDNDVMLNGKILSLILYGANTGGKTSYVNMVVLNQILAQTGPPIFAKSAEISMKENILLHYPEGAEIIPNQSRFDAELTRLESLLKEVGKFSLVVFDEAFTGTEVRAGSTQLKDVIFVLNTVGCHFMVTTHFHNLIDYVDTLKSVENSHFTLPNLKGGKELNYKLQPGGSKKSFGLNVVRRKKLDLKSMLKLVERQTTEK